MYFLGSMESTSSQSTTASSTKTLLRGFGIFTDGIFALGFGSRGARKTVAFLQAAAAFSRFLLCFPPSNHQIFLPNSQAWRRWLWTRIKGEAFEGNEEDKALLGLLDELKDQVASESSIPLSPQWLFAKPTEPKMIIDML
ncbi:uncharacterized protein LOC122305307 isoform X3 [Carya illinoinensis]|nr:uncharacterized protein LOC122305307 isoform X3 [Carya illinoinensis]